MDLAAIIAYIAIFNLLLLCVFFSFQTYYKRIAIAICFNIIGMILTILGNLSIYLKSSELVLNILFPMIYLVVYGCPPTLYYIVNRLLNDNYKSDFKNIFHYIPVLISVSALTWYYLQSPQYHSDFTHRVLVLGRPPLMNFLDALFVIQSIIYTVICYRKIYLARKSAVKNDNAKWLWRLINFIVASCAILFPVVLIYPTAVMVLMVTSLLSVFYYLALIINLLKLKNNEVEKLFNKINIQPKNSIIFSENDSTINIATKIEVAMHQDKIYKNKSLTVNDLANHCELPQYIVSQFLTKYYSKPFNEFINDFRVEEIIRLLNGKEINMYSIEMIGQICGFNSKSAFYGAFKRYTGVTPRQYVLEARHQQDDVSQCEIESSPSAV